jgi:hypothetical protein
MRAVGLIGLALALLVVALLAGRQVAPAPPPAAAQPAVPTGTPQQVQQQVRQQIEAAQQPRPLPDDVK